jgi:transcriptional regulator with XRE-family HTH domain
MRTTCTNIYKTARHIAGFTQEQAAEMLHISVRSLADYEGNRTIPGDDIVCRMIETYDAEWLGYQHLKESTKVGQRYLPDIEFVNLAQSVLRLQKEMADVDRIKPEMVEVAYDNIVHPYQEDTWSQATKEVLEMVGAGLGVLFYQKEKRPSAKGAY